MSKLKQLLNYIFVIATIMMIAVVVLIPTETTYSEWNHKVEYEEGWRKVEGNDKDAVITFPHDIEDGKVKIVNILPKVKDDSVLILKCNYRTMNAYVEGEHIFRSDVDKLALATTDLGHYCAIIPLEEEYSNKEILVEIEERLSGYHSDISYVEITTAGAYAFERIVNSSLNLVFAAAMVTIAILSFAGWYIFRKSEDGVAFFYTGVFSLTMGTWILSDSHLYGIVTGRYTGSGIINYLAFMLIPTTVLGMLKAFSRKKDRIVNVGIKIAQMIFVIEVVLFLSGVYDLSDMLFFMQIQLPISMFVIVLYVLMKYKELKSEKILIFGLTISAVFLVLSLVFYALGRNWMPMATSGMAIFTLATMLKNVLDVSNSVQQTQISAMNSQIRPHFIFNSLAAIQQLCKENPEDAQEALGNFSSFLRKRMDASSLKRCVSFEYELEIVKNYLYLEQKRFGKSLKVEYDITERNFMIPALTVQPIVENAVRHGVRQKKGGGTIRISTYKDLKNYIVKISDDGAGFDTSKIKDDGKFHIGIDNASKRLDIMCKGTLEISSVVGVGTVVTLKIPIKATDNVKE